jgi:hypothetical protein
MSLFRSFRFEKRYQIINYFIRTRGFESYLEIGTSTGKCMARIRCARREGIDPAPRGEGKGWTLHRETSDEFFAGSRDRYDIIFVDGLHHSDQAVRDVFNGLHHLTPKGVLLVHDCNPLTEEAQRRDPCRGTWNGDVWKSVAFIRAHVPQLFCRVIARDQGVGLVLPRDYDRIPSYTEDLETHALEFMGSLTWDDLESRREEVLGLIESREEMETLLSETGMGT